MSRDTDRREFDDPTYHHLRERSDTTKDHRPFADCHPRCGFVGIGQPVHDERCKNRRDASQEGR